MKKTRIFIALFCIFMLASPVLGWDNNVSHPNMTNAAADFLVSEHPEYDFLNNYIYFNISTDSQLTFMDEGSVKEDYALSADWNTGVWGSQQDVRVQSLSWKSHGYDPLTGETWYEMPDFDNTFLYSESIWNDVISASNTYFQIGRFCHIIEDMASPAHANADLHIDGDDLESYSEYHYDEVAYQPVSQIRNPATDGLAPQAGLPHPDLTTNYYGNYIRNVAWRTYYMVTYYGGSLVESEGDKQPDSELKRMFPYNGGSGLRYDDGGWFVNDHYMIDDVGYNWIGYGIGNNPDWWDCPDDSGYFYLENIDGDWSTCDPSIAGNGVAPAVFKTDKFRRVMPSDNLSLVLATNSKIFARLYCENLNPMATEWAAGFVQFAADTLDLVPPPPEIEVSGNGNAIADGDTSPSQTDNTVFGFDAVKTFTISNTGGRNLSLDGSPIVKISGPYAGSFVVSDAPVSIIAAGGSDTFEITYNPSTIGLYSATVSITNNDENEDPYDFSIQGIGITDQAKPCFTWDTVAGATRYELCLQNQLKKSIFKKWFTAGSVDNDDGTCSACPGAVLVSGDYYWLIRTENSLGIISPWSVKTPFIVDTVQTPPAAPTLNSPTGAIAETAPTFEWNTVAEATHYKLYIQNQFQKNIFYQWYAAADVDNGGGTCSVNPGRALSPGDYYWLVRAKNEYGEGPISTKMAFTIVP